MIRQTEVDGVRTLVAPNPGPMRAGLVFRVGFADEPLPRRGITHLVEHLALHRHGQTDHHANAATSVTTTHFFTEGTPEEVVAYLSAVCESLANLPMDRLPLEKSVLRTEEAGRSTSSLALWRYGALGHGTAGYPEWGVDGLGPDDLRQWVASRFTRENAVLWIAGQVPPGLRLALPSGPVNPIPAPTSALPTTPAFYSEATTSVSFSGIVRRRPEAPLFAGLLDRLLFRALRQEDGNSYSPSATYLARDADFGQILAFADALPEKQSAVLGGFVDVLATVRLGRIDEADLAAVRGKALANLDRPDAEAEILPSSAVDLLVGNPWQTVEQRRKAVEAITVEDMRAVAVEAISTGLLQVPRGLGADWAGFTQAPLWSTTVVHGNRHASLEHEGRSLVLGDQGVSLVTGDGTVTVLFRECVALQCWPDGARRLIGMDALSVGVEPTLFDLPPTAIGWLDAQVHPSVRIVMPARSHVPRPSPKTEAAPAPARRSRSAVNKIGLVVVGLAVAFFGLLALVGTVVAVTDPQPDQDATGAIALWAVTLIAAGPFALLWSRGRRR
ncbi:M16 family metallopeptidase [Kutzneria sp. NPDC052558]|uniref:M16 family metallopeptidase n=1 Tax=Kutzneria sp. NPDC052558 TaxID=3364121 RepID=UPI0037C9E2E7